MTRCARPVAAGQRPPRERMNCRSWRPQLHTQRSGRQRSNTDILRFYHNQACLRAGACGASKRKAAVPRALPPTQGAALEPQGIELISL